MTTKKKISPVEYASQLKEDKEHIEHSLERINNLKFEGRIVDPSFGHVSGIKHYLDKTEFKYIKDYLLRRYTRKRQEINRKIKKFEGAMK